MWSVRVLRQSGFAGQVEEGLLALPIQPRSRHVCGSKLFGWSRVGYAIVSMVLLDVRDRCVKSETREVWLTPLIW